MQNSDLQRILHIMRYCDDIAQFMDRFGDYNKFSTEMKSSGIPS